MVNGPSTPLTMGKQRKTTHKWPPTIQNNKKQCLNNAKQHHNWRGIGLKMVIPGREADRDFTEKLPGA